MTHAIINLRNAGMWRQLLQQTIDAQQLSKTELAAIHGKVWDAAELSADFAVFAHLPPFTYVRRRSDDMYGTVTYQDSPRFYFEFVANSPWQAPRAKPELTDVRLIRMPVSSAYYVPLELTSYADRSLWDLIGESLFAHVHDVEPFIPGAADACGMIPVKLTSDMTPDRVTLSISGPSWNPQRPNLYLSMPTVNVRSRLYATLILLEKPAPRTDDIPTEIRSRRIELETELQQAGVPDDA